MDSRPVLYPPKSHAEMERIDLANMRQGFRRLEREGKVLHPKPEE
jgi:hypothetical protein